MISNFVIKCKKCNSNNTEITPVSVILDDDNKVTAHSIEMFCANCGEIQYTIDPK